MKSVIELSLRLLQEAGRRCCVDTKRDEVTLVARVEHEGIAFLAITLPAFCKDLERSVADGRVSSNAFAGFARTRGLPRFLGGFLRRLFHKTGLLRVDVDAGVFADLRQVLLLVSKLELPVSQARLRRAERAYVDTDKSIRSIQPELLAEFKLEATRLLGAYLDGIEKELVFDRLPSRHSSGESANRLSQNSRWADDTWTERLNEVFPWWDDLAINWRDASCMRPALLDRDAEPPVRVTSVPKTLKGPRIIAMEPSWMMFVQQGILAVMTSHLRRHRVLDAMFGWTDQDPNRSLSREGSVDGSYATIDLSEASDRVSLELASALFHRHPALLRRVLACRSTHASVGGEVIELKKFASMGSALCFPVESMVFATIASLGMRVAARRDGRQSSEERVMPDPRRVYGDDIIVPAYAAQDVLTLLEAFGLKVNARKTFTTGRFRESCGADWLSGSDVSVFRLHHLLPEDSNSPVGWESAIAFHNHAFTRGWEDVARYVAERLDALRHVPRCRPGFLGSALFSWGKPRTRFNPRLQRLEQAVLAFKNVKPVDPLQDYGALRKVFRTPRVEPLDSDHLTRAGRSRCVSMNTGWQPVA